MAFSAVRIIRRCARVGGLKEESRIYNVFGGGGGGNDVRDGGLGTEERIRKGVLEERKDCRACRKWVSISSAGGDVLIVPIDTSERYCGVMLGICPSSPRWCMQG